LARIPIIGTDIYEWLPGGFFLVHHVDVMIGDQRGCRTPAPQVEMIKMELITIAAAARVAAASAI
jgi:hypothetical protein